MTGIAFLHTAEAHEPTFAGLMSSLAPDLPACHIVDDSLLADAMAAGAVTGDIRQRIGSRLRQAAGEDVDLVICTCSTIGGVAETLGGSLGVPVMRIDRAMAERAVELGPRITIAACLESTVAPTTDLLEQVAGETDRRVEVTTLVIAGAWDKFVAGDPDGYHAAIADGLGATAGTADVVVLAQASMAPAAERCRGLGTVILSSPELGVRRAVAMVAGGA
jgi:hypothetical protein